MIFMPATDKVSTVSLSVHAIGLQLAMILLFPCQFGNWPAVTYQLPDRRRVVLGLPAAGDLMAAWWKRLTSAVLDTEASRFIQLHGDRAYEVARQAARNARNKRDAKKARYFSHMALKIAEMSGREIGLDTATRMAERAER